MLAPRSYITRVHGLILVNPVLLLMSFSASRRMLWLDPASWRSPRNHVHATRPAWPICGSCFMDFLYSARAVLFRDAPNLGRIWRVLTFCRSAVCGRHRAHADGRHGGHAGGRDL